MFDKIDFKLIDLTQLTLRHLELYTKKERAELLSILLSLIKILNILFAIGVILISFFIFWAIFWSILIPGNRNLYYSLKETVVKQKNTTALPKEIISRKLSRMMVHFQLFLAIMLFSIFCNIGNLFIFLVLILFLDVLIEFCIEYLLCTTSLPPGEKQKRQEEQETKNMTPI